MSSVENLVAVPVGVYIHIPFCRKKCDYCAFCSTPDLSLVDEYIKTLTSEIRESREKYGIKKADSIYVGGGTPSCLPRGVLCEIFDALSHSYDIANDAEITVEANPESCDVGFAKESRSVGANRISMGLQSGSDTILKSIGRIHSVDGYIEAANILHEQGFENISSDLIIGLPGQGSDDVERALGIFDKYCAHASVYALAVEKGTPLYARGFTPDDDFVADLYAFACKKLSDCGFERYEVSNFARKGKTSVHNKKYWARLPYDGYGVAAHGFDGDRTRCSHSDDIAAYISGEKPHYSVLTDKDCYNEYVMLSLRTERGIKVSDLKSKFGIDIFDYKKKEISELIALDALAISDDRLYITPKKMFVMNSIIEELMD